MWILFYSHMLKTVHELHDFRKDGILGHIWKLRLHSSSRKIIKPPCLFLTRALKKKVCLYSQMLSRFKIINSLFLTTVEQALSMQAMFSIFTVFQYLIRKPRHSPGGPNQIYIMMLLNCSKQWSPIDGEILTVANGPFKLYTCLNSTQKNLINYAGYKSRYKSNGKKISRYVLRRQSQL